MFANSCADRYESLAYFTSIGPTTDNRIKPDIVAPGTTISATLCAPSHKAPTASSHLPVCINASIKCGAMGTLAPYKHSSYEFAAEASSRNSPEADTIPSCPLMFRTNGVSAQQAVCAAPRPLAEVAALQGTSMATPLAAGSAALVREYFLKGFYPSGAATPAAAFAPSGVLVKAVMLGA